MRAAKENDATTAEQYSRESVRIARTTRELLKKFAGAYHQRLAFKTCMKACNPTGSRVVVLWELGKSPFKRGISISFQKKTHTKFLR